MQIDVVLLFAVNQPMSSFSGASPVDWMMMSGLAGFDLNRDNILNYLFRLFHILQLIDHPICLVITW